MYECICPICDKSADLYFKGLFDDRHGRPGLYDIYSCDSCGHKFLDQTFTDDEIIALYNTYYPTVACDSESIMPLPDVTNFTTWLNGDNSFAYKWVSRNVRVLDIGCGFGETLGYHKNRGCEVFGVETDEHVRDVAKRFGAVFHAGVFTKENYKESYFDYITLDQVVEHFPDPIGTLTNVATILKRGGIAVVCTPNQKGWGAAVFGRKWINWHVPYHVQMFTIESMEILASKCGLTMDKAVTATSSTWLYYQLMTLVCYTEPGMKNLFWGATRSPTLTEHLATKLINVFNKTRIFHVITRVFDCFGCGDNLVFILKKK